MAVPATKANIGKLDSGIQGEITPSMKYIVIGSPDLHYNNKTKEWYISEAEDYGLNFDAKASDVLALNPKEVNNKNSYNLDVDDGFGGWYD